MNVHFAHSYFSKAPTSERRRLERLLSQQESSIQQAFAEFMSGVKSPAAMREVRLLLEAGNIEGALRIVDSYVLRLGSAVTTAFQAAGAAEGAALASSLAPAIALTFDPTNPRAAAIMRRNRLKFIEDFTRSQREVTRQAIVDALRAGEGPIKTGRAFRDSIGLTLFQRRAVDNYRRLLEQGSREALARDVRDRRFDRTVERAIDSGEPLSTQQINRMVQRYQQRFTQLRAETIARTEGLRAVSQARQEAFEQVIEQAGIPEDKVIRVWRSPLDDRTRDTHRAMNGQQRGLRVPFASPSGARLMFPGDPNAPAREVINCRCVLTHTIIE
jgi:hypothetical protein